MNAFNFGRFNQPPKLYLDLFLCDSNYRPKIANVERHWNNVINYPLYVSNFGEISAFWSKNMTRNCYVFSLCRYILAKFSCDSSMITERDTILKSKI